MKSRHPGWIALALTTANLIGGATTEADWPAATAPLIAETDGYVAIPGVAVPPRKDRVYRAIFDATRAAGKPTQLLPALNLAGSEVNAFFASNVPLRNLRFVIIFHADALAGILDESHYKAKFGVENPNLAVLAKLKEAGVKLFVCGQQLATDKVDPKTLAADVTVASDALIVLMTFQNDGYALLSF